MLAELSKTHFRTLPTAASPFACYFQVNLYPFLYPECDGQFLPDGTWPSSTLHVSGGNGVNSHLSLLAVFLFIYFLCVIKMLEVMCGRAPVPPLGPEVNMQGFHEWVYTELQVY